MNKILFFTILSLFLSFPCLAADIDLSELTKLTGEAAGDAAGSVVGPAGDVNGDGYPDFLVSAISDDTNGNNAGAVYIIYGKTEVITNQSLSQADVKITGVAAGDRIGSALAAGDINGDGYSDLLISAIYEDTGGENAGAVYLIYGSNSLSSTIDLSSANVKLIGEAANDNAGKGLAAGDVNGDGYDDIFVGASFADPNGDSSGAAYLIYGSDALASSIDLSLANAKFIGEDSNNFAGWSIDVEDINGDSYGDILIGAFSNSNANGSNAGAVYLIEGSASAFSGSNNLSLAQVKFIGENVADYAGRAVASEGDVNGDGYNDILIGAVGEDAGASEAGSAYLIHGGNSLSGTISLSQAQVKFTGEESVNDFGESLTGLGDVNGDGYDDILIGAYQNAEGGDMAGAAYLVYGSDTLSGTYAATNESIVKFIGEEAEDGVGQLFSAVGDLNQDGHAEMALDASGYGEAGVVYLSYLYIDADNDDVPGDQGLFSGTDCNDNDATVYEEQTYYIDADSDGLGDSGTTVTICSSTPPDGYVNNADDPDDSILHHSDYYDYDPTDTSLHDSTITWVKGWKRGKIRVKYIDDSIYKYTIFNNNKTKKKTKVKHYRQTGYYLVAQALGKKLALVNIFNGQTLKRKKLSTKKKYQYNNLKVFKLRKKYWSVLTSKNKKNKVRLAVVRIKINQEKFGKKKTKISRSKRIKVSKTKKKKNKIRLRNKKGKTIKKYLMTKKKKLKLVK